jgi:hypothetical protein
MPATTAPHDKNEDEDLDQEEFEGVAGEAYAAGGILALTALVSFLATRARERRR